MFGFGRFVFTSFASEGDLCLAGAETMHLLATSAQLILFQRFASQRVRASSFSFTNRTSERQGMKNARRDARTFCSLLTGLRLGHAPCGRFFASIQFPTSSTLSAITGAEHWIPFLLSLDVNIHIFSPPRSGSFLRCSAIVLSCFNGHWCVGEALVLPFFSSGGKRAIFLRSGEHG